MITWSRCCASGAGKGAKKGEVRSSCGKPGLEHGMGQWITIKRLFLILVRAEVVPWRNDKVGFDRQKC